MPCQIRDWKSGQEIKSDLRKTEVKSAVSAPWEDEEMFERSWRNLSNQITLNTNTRDVWMMNDDSSNLLKEKKRYNFLGEIFMI